MTRKHYVAIAEALAGERPFRSDFTDEHVYAARLAVWNRIILAIGDVLAADNGRFDRGRFEYAAGAR